MGFAVCAGAQLIKTEERAATPARIVVGGRVQAAYWGPAPQWSNSGGAALSDQQIGDLGGARDPGDLCARGYLIAHGRQGVARRMDHVVWMIDHHPEWDGFLLNLSRSGYGELDGDGVDRVRGAWLKQIGSEQRSGMVLHHAAVFGALSAIHPSPKAGRGGDWVATLRARLRELGWGGGTEMPSRSARYGRYGAFWV
ncbi:MAG: hypothetical protein U0R19_18875 [Bryobacteraceae bacterium]